MCDLLAIQLQWVANENCARKKRREQWEITMQDNNYRGAQNFIRKAEVPLNERKRTLRIRAIWKFPFFRRLFRPFSLLLLCLLLSFSALDLKKCAICHVVCVLFLFGVSLTCSAECCCCWPQNNMIVCVSWLKQSEFVCSDCDFIALRDFPRSYFKDLYIHRLLLTHI